MKVLIIILFLISINCFRVYSQQLNLNLYNNSNGLLNNNVHCILQASNGFMYFGTPAGLSVFDGSSFRSYGTDKGFGSSLISGINELKPQQFTLFTNSGRIYQVKNQRLALDTFTQPVSVKNVYQGKSGRWYASSYSGLYSFDDGKLNKLPISRGHLFPGINCVMEWQDSLLIVGRSYEHLDIYNIKNWKLVASSAEKLFVRNIFEDAAKNVWIASIGSGMLLLTPGSLRGEHIVFQQLPSAFSPFLHSEFRAVVGDRKKNIWMASVNDGLLEYNPLTGAFRQVTTEQGLASNTVFCLCCDREDNIWIGTNSGVQKLVHKNVFSYSSKQGLPEDLILDLLSLPDHGAITCGYSGVGYTKDFGKKITAWHPPLDDEYFLKLTRLKNEYFGLSLKKLVSLHISPASVSARKLYPLPMHFRSMIPFEEDKLLLGGDSCILLFQGGKMNILTKNNVRLISCMAFDSTGMLWTGSLNNDITGYAIEKKSNKTNCRMSCTYKANPVGAEDFVQCITFDHKKRIIYGMSQSGLFVLSWRNQQLTPFMSLNANSGLSNNHVESMLWINDSTLLAGTGSGLDKIIFPENSDSFYVHNISDFYNFSTTIYSIRKDSEGNILLGTEQGLIRIPSVDIENYTIRKLPIVISSIQLLNGEDSLIDTQKAIELPYYNNGINIHYSSPSYTNEKNIKYVYRLSGSIQNNWSQPSFSNRVTLLNLSPGHYQFTVVPINMYGLASSDKASLEIVIRSPVWQRWWFEILFLLAIVTLTVWLVRRRIRLIRRESAMKNKMAETEMMALRAQMNPHFIFNCMNIIDGLITNDRKEEALDFLQKFSKLIRLILENSQYQEVPLQQDLQALRLYIELEVIRSNYHFTYVFDIDPELYEESYQIPPLLLQPYIENAIVHGLRNKENGFGKLFLGIKKFEKNVSITIEDNGVGRARAIELNRNNVKTHQPLGMKVTEKRIELLKMTNHKNVHIDITDMNQPGDTGTKVNIRLPLDLKI